MRKVIFVFGSNRQGIHGAGAAREAIEHWGAVYGQAHGLQGNSYAIVTKELRKSEPPVSLEEVRVEVDIFIEFAKRHSDYFFIVTAIGCGLAGFTPEQIAPLFEGCPENVFLPTRFMIGKNNEEMVR
jgi:hypothetical protein